ncbi:MAG: hypothetical protein M0Z56_03405 [Desulfobacteraceae bacterium]|nr:hypothetical protein [Desulfobacteraceae bacterium]
MKTCTSLAVKKLDWRMDLIFIGIFIFLMGFGIPSPVVAGDTPKPAGANPATVTIRGFISNIDDIGAYVVNETFLQLYPCEITGNIKIPVDKQGRPLQPVVPAGQTFYLDALRRLVPPSGLPSTVFPDFGSFSFDKIEGLTPGGCYKICLKMLDLPYPGLVPLVGPDGKTREIIVPETRASSSSQDMVIDLTKEVLRVPDPSHLPRDPGRQAKQPAGINPGADFWK